MTLTNRAARVVMATHDLHVVEEIADVVHVFGTRPDNHPQRRP